MKTVKIHWQTGEIKGTKEHYAKLREMQYAKYCKSPVRFIETSVGAFNNVIYWYKCEKGHNTGSSEQLKFCEHERKSK